MKNQTFRFACFAPFDFQGVEQHLTTMAAKGWRLEKADGSLWSYRRAQPARVHCAVTCPPEGDGETPDRLFFQDLCASAGWEAVLQERSFFGSRTVYAETDRQESGEQSSLRYELYDVPSAWVYGLLRDDLLDLEGWFPHRPEDPAPWGADAAYQRYDNGRSTGVWLICWPGRLAELQRNGLEAGQITAAARLAPESGKEETR